MKSLELTEDGPLSACANQAQKDTIVLTRRGKPVAAVVGFGGADWEDLAVGSDPDFLALIERSRRRYKPGSGRPIEDVRHRHGLPPRPVSKRTARPRRRSR